MNNFAKKVSIVTTTILASSFALPFAQSNKIIQPTQNKTNIM